MLLVEVGELRLRSHIRSSAGRWDKGIFRVIAFVPGGNHCRVREGGDARRGRYVDNPLSGYRTVQAVEGAAEDHGPVEQHRGGLGVDSEQRRCAGGGHVR
ncbi:hypothetical protein GALLR39Z86_03680 [Glycomyces algeriensis]|uniref:Uncharacterized protein n=1 Tax=Glycomyces algeriensis TaxID=256037 RepID=A0A9W6G547_9ACTN|nr:hypothetical protein GALLR39Z86_03680 [Glycomyces algeriensis]